MMTATLECKYCHRKGFMAAHVLRTHETACKILGDFSLDCYYCARSFDTAGGRRIHEAICSNRPLTPTRPPKVSLHLTEEEVFAKTAAPKTILSGTHKAQAVKRHLRKREERFDRRLKRIKASKRAKRAIKHGWKPTNTVRNIKTDQL